MTSDKKSFNDAFAKLAPLKKQLEEQAKAPPPPPPPKKTEKPKPDDDAVAFQRAMSGVKKLGDDGRGERVRPKEEVAARVEDETDALIELASAVDTGKGLDPNVMRKLERGEIAFESELDLHGMRKAEAEAALEKFLKQARASKLRCVLVVTGKGLHSDAAGPVLGDAVRAHLLKSPHVLAATAARPEHGGEGAMYVLLRKR